MFSITTTPLFLVLNEHSIFEASVPAGIESVLKISPFMWSMLNG